MKLHAALAAALRDHGVDTLFGVIGDANLFMVDRFVRDQGGHYVGACHEAGAVLMATGYAATSSRVGVATVTHGPGLTNAVTALVDGVRGRAPVVLLAGDTPVDADGNPQDIDQRHLVASTGAGFVQMRSASTALEDTARAFRRAALERCPIVLNIPADLQWADISYVAVDRRAPAGCPPAPDPDALDRAAGVAASARRPVVLAGRGATSPAAREALIRLAARTGAALATTLKAKDLFRGEAFDLGIFGTVSTPVALDAVLASDCILAFGASLNPFTTARGSLVEGRSLVHVDVDAEQINQRGPRPVGVVGDAAVVADALVRRLDEAGVRAGSFRSSDLLTRLGAVQADVPGTSPVQTGVDVSQALRRLDAILPVDRVLVSDAGRFMYEAWRLLAVPAPSRFVPTMNFGSIGLGVPSAIGAHLGAPGSPVVLVSGDGGFMLGGLAEFSTAVRHGIDLIVVVLNDGGYGAEHIQFRQRGMDPALSLFEWPDLVAVARALGGEGAAVRQLADLEELQDVVARRQRPLLIDVMLDPDSVPNTSL